MSRLAITLGDVTGVGPELVARTVLSGTLHQIAVTIVGDPEVLARAIRLCDGTETIPTIDSLDDAPQGPGRIAVWSPETTDVSNLPDATVQAAAGRAAHDYLIAAIDGTLAGRFDGIVTAPLNKAALRAGGIHHPGHTEILAERCGVGSHAMMLYLPPGEAVRGPDGLAIAHVTLHTSIASVPELLSRERVAGTIDLIGEFLRSLGLNQPRIGVCALNPHGGEGGLFGDEEERIIRPAIKAAMSSDRIVSGPFPTDTLIRRAVVAGEFDGIVAMYHDQGHIPIKLIGFDEAVNITLGLPLVRTSPTQGTAFDIAWRGIANPAGMIGAVRVAERLIG